MTSSRLRRVNLIGFSGIFALVALPIFWASFPATAKAQLSYAAINGTINDTTGAVVPGAAVILTNVATGVRRTITSNDAGAYVLLDILPGDYTLQVSKEGFTTVTQSKVTLYVNQTATFDFTLPVGTTKQSVSVQAAAPRVEASTSELGAVITAREVNDLPLNGRNFTQLLNLVPGSSPINVAQSNGGWLSNPIGDFSFPAINGERNRSNLFLLDGVIDEGSYLSTYSVPPIIDSIEEFKVQSHNDDAQFGQALGGIVNAATKSGTNSFHGDTWEFFRNDVLDAQNTFVSMYPKSVYTYNQFGASIGGPVILPYYNGRNKTFFFGAYEGFRNHVPGMGLGLVPTPEELTGDLSDLSILQPGIQIYNPYSTQPDPANPGDYLRDPFMCDASGNPLPANASGLQTTGTPCNKIPASLINAGAVTYAKAVYPTPIPTGVLGTNMIDFTPYVLGQDEMSVRGDEQIGNKNSAFGRYTAFWQASTGSGGLPTTTKSVSTFDAYQVAASWVHTISSDSLAQFSFGRVNQLGVPLSTFTSAVPSAAALVQETGMNQGFACGFHGPGFRDCYFPGAIISGYSGSGEGAVRDHVTSVYEWKADYSKLHGHHTFKTGVATVYSGYDSHTASMGISFQPFETSNLETSQGGNALASFLLGLPDSANRYNKLSWTHGWTVYGLYFSDQWRATNRLTVNYGARYDASVWPAFGNLSDNSAYVGDMDFTGAVPRYELEHMPPACSATQLAPCIPGGVLPANVYLAPPGGRLFHNSYDNIGPRLGLAYRLTSKLALRGSYGRFYDTYAGVEQIATNVAETWPSTGGQDWPLLNQVLPTVFYENPMAGSSGVTYPAATPFQAYAGYADPQQAAPYSDQWHLGFQRSLGSSTVLTANYVGSTTHDLDVGARYNTATPGPGDQSLRRQWPSVITESYQRHIGTSTYNGFQFSLDRKTSHGLSYLLSYTWSRAIDTPSSGYFYEGSTIQDPNNLKGDKAVSAFNQTNILVFSYVYALPNARKGNWSGGKRGLGYVLSDWQVNGIASLSDGQPYFTHMYGDIANTGNASGYERLNLVGNPNISNATPEEWFNPAAFSPPPEYTFGNEGRNILRSDWTRNLDMSLFREFPFTESKRLEFRVEAFNLFNTPQFGIPDNVYGDPLFGQALGTANSARQFQIALKIYF